MLFLIVDSSIHQSPKHYLCDHPMRRNRGVRVNVRSVIPILDEPFEILGFPNEGLLQSPKEVVHSGSLIIVSELDRVPSVDGCIYDYQAKASVLKPIFVHYLA